MTSKKFEVKRNEPWHAQHRKSTASRGQQSKHNKEANAVSTASRSSDSTASTAEHRRAHSTNQGGREGGINKGKGTAVKEQERTKAAKRATLCLAMKTMSQSTAKAQDASIRGEIVLQSGSKKPEQKQSSEETGRRDQTPEQQERQERRSKTGTNESVASNMGGTQAAPRGEQREQPQSGRDTTRSEE